MSKSKKTSKNIFTKKIKASKKKIKASKKKKKIKASKKKQKKINVFCVEDLLKCLK